MAKFIPAAVQDTVLDDIATSTRMFICTSEPATYAAAVAASVAEVTLASGDFSKSTPSAGVRRLNVAAKSGLSVTATGTANHVALGRASDTTLKFVTTCAATSVTTGGVLDVSAGAIDIGQPT